MRVHEPHLNDRSQLASCGNTGLELTARGKLTLRSLNPEHTQGPRRKLWRQRQAEVPVGPAEDVQAGRAERRARGRQARSGASAAPAGPQLLRGNKKLLIIT